jgi:hypothetical protein
MTCVLAVRTPKFAVVAADTLLDCGGDRRTVSKVVANEHGVVVAFAGTIGPLWRAITVEGRLRGVTTLDDAYRALASYNKQQVTDHQLHAAVTSEDFCAPEDILIATPEGVHVTDNAGSRSVGLRFPGLGNLEIEGVGTGRNAGICYVLASLKADKALANSAARMEKLLEQAIQAVSHLDSGVGHSVTTVVVR